MRTAKAIFLTMVVLVLNGAALHAAVNVSGTITCDGQGVAGVAVSDGYEIVLTDADGHYAMSSGKKNGYVFHMYRFRDHTHDMAGHMMATWPLQKEFLEQDVILGNRMTVDATIDDPNVPKLESVDLSDIYK